MSIFEQQKPQHEVEVKIANLLAEFRRCVTLIREGQGTEENCWAAAIECFGPATAGTTGAAVRDKMRKIVTDVYHPGVKQLTFR
jgi:hypothetical protein